MGLAEEAVNTASFDFGIIYRIGVRDLKLGMVIQNLGGKITYDELPAKMPTIFKVGASFHALDGHDHKVLASAEFPHPADNAERVNLGLEYAMRDLLFARGGYHLGYDTDGMAWGFGVVINTGKDSRAMFDYSYVDMGALDYVNRLTLTFVY